MDAAEDFPVTSQSNLSTSSLERGRFKLLCPLTVDTSANLAIRRSKPLRVARLRIGLIQKGIAMLKRLIFLVSKHFPSFATPIVSFGCCCFVPICIATTTLVCCFVFGTFICCEDLAHVGFELFLATGAVIVHHSSSDILRRIRAWRQSSKR